MPRTRSSRGAGYRLVTPPGSVYSHVFEHLYGEGWAALAVGDHARAGSTLREALALRRGPVPPDLPEAPPRRPGSRSCGRPPHGTASTRIRRSVAEAGGAPGPRWTVRFVEPASLTGGTQIP
ncbi:hypothetical protein STENM223S_00091 [Streptomyces tendae]